MLVAIPVRDPASAASLAALTHDGMQDLMPGTAAFAPPATTAALATPTATAAAAAAAPRRRGLFYGWYMIGGMMGIHWYVSASFVYGFGVLFVPILETFGWSRSVGSLTALFMQPVGGAVGPLIGAFVDRHGARPVAIAGVVCIGLGIMSLAFMQALWMLFLSFSLVSIGMSSTMGVGFNTAIVNWFRRQRGKALGIGFSGGALSGPFVVVVVWLEATYGWRESALILGAGMLLLGLPCAWLIRSKPSDKGLNPDGDSDAQVAAMGNPVEGGMTSGGALKDRNFWLLALIYGVLATGISGFMLHQIPYLVSLGFSREAGAASLAVMTLVSLLGRVLGGMLMDFLARRDFDLRIVPAILLAIQTASLLVIAYATSYWHVVIFASLFGISFGGMIPSRPVLVGSLFGLPSFGTIQGLMNFTSVPFSVISPVILGLFFDLDGTYFTGVLFLAALSAAAIPIAFLLRLPRGPEDRFVQRDDPPKPQVA